MKYKKFLEKSFEAFSLLEIAISLAIIGILTLAVIKGQSLLYQARLDKTVAQIESIKISIETFRSTYGNLPGDYNGDELQVEKKGDGNGIIGENEAKEFWQHLEAAGLLTKQQTTPALGGVFTIMHNAANDLPGHWILFSNPGNLGIMSSKDAIALKLKIDGSSDNTSGSVRIKKADGKGGFTQMETTKQKECIIFIEFP